MGRLLVSVRGPNEALAAAEGGAHIPDVEYPASALGTPYSLNIRSAACYSVTNGARIGTVHPKIVTKLVEAGR